MQPKCFQFGAVKHVRLAPRTPVSSSSNFESIRDSSYEISREDRLKQVVVLQMIFITLVHGSQGLSSILSTENVVSSSHLELLKRISNDVSVFHIAFQCTGVFHKAP